MWRSVSIALLGAATAAGALQACGGTGPGREDVAVQRLDTRLCEKALECGCPPGFDAFGMPLESECGGWEAGETDAEPGYATDLAFDPTCVERWVEWLDERPCDATALPSYTDFCPLYHGTLREGEACGQYFFSLRQTECERSLYCLAGQCRDPRRTAFGMQGQPCDLGDRCDDGLTCFDAVCLRLPGPGEPCLSGYLCSPDARCSDIVCVALPDVGERCDSGDCRTGSFCSFDSATGTSTCRLLGDAGDLCSGHRQCASSYCPAGVCEPPAEAGAPCGSQLPCGPGLACVADRCQAAACTLLEEI
jgi:hypothetical protein